MDDDERQVRLEAAALLFESSADELEHVRAGEVPRGAAHAWAALGHLKTGEDRLMVQAREHRERSSL